MSYDHASIEKKWQERWKAEGLHTTDLTKTDKKRYLLVEYPYPSGNLHIGHWYAFAVPDIYARKKRMEGENVFFPIGFDSFGLPAENAAIKRNLDPKQWTYDNIAYMTKQLESMGNSFDWSAKVITSDPSYYRWTQWLFLQFFKKGLVYRGTTEVNWCPSCNTVLANEQVVAGHCERCGHVVEKRTMEQWMMRITEYADRLIDDLDPLDWPEEIKNSQRNWIGRSEGYELEFDVKEGGKIQVFTTRPDTLYGATCAVLAPEHPLVSTLPYTNKEAVAAYVQETAKRTEIERTTETKDKTGVKLEGVSVIHPLTKKELPIFIADYVLAQYGTGAIMTVPGHDSRDHSFAEKHGGEIIEVIDRGSHAFPYEGAGKLINSDEFNGLESETAKSLIAAKAGGKAKKTYKLRDWSISRQRYWGVPIPIVYDPEGKPHPIPDEHLPWLLPEDVDFKPTGTAPLARSQELKERTEKIFGAGWKPEVETMDTFVDSSWYFLRYLAAQNEKEFAPMDIQKAWMPVDLYSGGAEHTTMHVLYSRFVTKALYDLGLVSVNEPYKRRMNRGLILGPDGNKMSKSKGNVIDPDEQVSRVGADVVKMYLAFIGPFNETGTYPWDMGGIAGIRRFLERIWKKSEQLIAEAPVTEKELHRTIAKATTDVDALKFNTAISSLMSFLNVADKEGITQSQYETMLKLAAPFAPHVADELWEKMGHTTSIHTEAWPESDPALAERSEAVIAIQVNGKLRGTITVPKDTSEEEVTALGLAQENVVKHLAGAIPKKTIYIKGKVLNVVL